MNHLRLKRSIATAFGVSLAMVSAVSCGSRTGLFGPSSEAAITGDSGTSGADASVIDASIRDAEPDVVPCIPGRVDLELATAQLMFVIDRSGSMGFTLDGREPEDAPGVPSRWQVLRAGLSQAITPYDQQIAMGVKFFPEFNYIGQLSCQTSDTSGIPPARGNAAAILAEYDSSDPWGGTPTSAALRIAADQLASRRAVARTIVLATDGAPNCSPDVDTTRCVCTNTPPDCGRFPNPESCLDDLGTVATIKSISDGKKIPVFVIGIGSLENARFRQTLTNMAIAGGRPLPTAPSYYSVQTPAEMDGALTTIRDGVAKCTFLTASSPSDPNAIEIEIDGVRVRRDPTRQDGWDWVDQTYGALAFFGTACEKLQAPGTKVSGNVSCTTK